MKIGTGCQYMGYFYFRENLNWVSQSRRLGRMQPAGWTQLS